MPWGHAHWVSGSAVVVVGTPLEPLIANVKMTAERSNRPIKEGLADMVAERTAKQLIADHPDVNVLINNAGIMQFDQAAGKIDDALLLATVNTSLIGPIRMTSALIEHLKTQDGAVVAYTSSVLGFVPLAVTAVYSSTKAALHSYVLSQRFMLRDTQVRVLEIAPPWVRTELMYSQEAEQAMPLSQFIAEAIMALGTEAKHSTHLISLPSWRVSSEI